MARRSVVAQPPDSRPPRGAMGPTQKPSLPDTPGSAPAHGGQLLMPVAGRCFRCLHCYARPHIAHRQALGLPCLQRFPPRRRGGRSAVQRRKDRRPAALVIIWVSHDEDLPSFLCRGPAARPWARQPRLELLGAGAAIGCRQSQPRMAKEPSCLLQVPSTGSAAKGTCLSAPWSICSTSPGSLLKSPIACHGRSWPQACSSSEAMISAFATLGPSAILRYTV